MVRLTKKGVSRERQLLHVDLCLFLCNREVGDWHVTSLLCVFGKDAQKAYAPGCACKQLSTVFAYVRNEVETFATGPVR